MQPQPVSNGTTVVYPNPLFPIGLLELVAILAVVGLLVAGVIALVSARRRRD